MAQYCLDCGETAMKDDQFCYYCGEPIPSASTPDTQNVDQRRGAQCDDCGARIASDDQYCYYCGTQLRR
ncbi:Double zinc ribbon [Halovenus aranensis]|uniref:Double zinc ribbon n=1 Tax=Halovenus aranensis TaxID=890420 RepID=A0A1G8TGN3_9EURY|nr:zinc ribbon domain-containing protein [Halovenus aranensis]SDJ40567.1 Double zinc ribbon [Halovenus aranensis]